MEKPKRKQASNGANALTCGIMGIILGAPIAFFGGALANFGEWGPTIIALVPLFFSLVGVIVGIVAIKKDENKKLAKAGLIVSIVAIVLIFLAFIVAFILQAAGVIN